MTLELRVAQESDRPHIVEWLLQPGVLKWFPLHDLREVEDAARISLSYAAQGAALTAVKEGRPVGFANLYLQLFEKLKHQALFMVIVDERERGQGVGRALIESLERLGREQFQLELLHLEVYDGNPAVRLYQRMGFKRYGYHPRFLKDEHGYLGKLLLQKKLR